MAGDPKDRDHIRQLLDQRSAARPDIVLPTKLGANVVSIYSSGVKRGDSTGWLRLDEHYTVAPGQLTTITGYPNMGKSQFTDALCLNLAQHHGWRFVMCSLENIPHELHVIKLLQQLKRAPFYDGPTPRMSMQDVQDGVSELAQWFRFVSPSEYRPNPSLDDVLESCKHTFSEWGYWEMKRTGLVIDPWNELEHIRPHGQSLTEFVGESLSRIRQWCRRHLLHVFVVAHPSKQYRNRETQNLPDPKPDMISDSAHFWNKSDNCITVHIPDGSKEHLVDICVHKIRFSHIGRKGKVVLAYNRVDGTYSETDEASYL